MIYLQKGEENIVRMVIKDIETTENPPRFTFSIKNVQSNNETLFISEDAVPNQPFYSSFTISCFTYSDIYNSIISDPIGDYDLKVYYTGDEITLGVTYSRVVYNDILRIVGEDQVIIDNVIDIDYKINVIP